ncbi:Phospholipase D epsilon [Apostasia shenzhenica]|uniref:Phospholipase D epsilon n=1 Tax=Apostasia shenzhenica TaxID=1088818 RepID=A0A2I0AFZ5_9ASPA|nr:Phospholipase D epsilon [Apostasia shenzhenica]
MDGERDTEIAIGCRQRTAHNGEIFTYRMSLWYEHTGGVVEAFAEPESLECVETMRAIGDEMWKRYSGEEVVDMEGVHLVSYPVAVSEDGMTRDLEEGGGVFPDSGVRIGGRRSKILPPACTC